MTEIVEVDFGKEQIEAARDFKKKLGHLMDIAAAHDAAIIRNPKPYLARAADEIVRLRGVIRAAGEALYPAIPLDIHAAPFAPSMFDTIVVDKEEWTRLQKMRRIIEAADRG